jgi:hypothetical protein
VSRGSRAAEVLSYPVSLGVINTETWSWFQSYVAMLMRSALFWGITRRRVIIVYRRFGTTYRYHLHGSHLSKPE